MTGVPTWTAAEAEKLQELWRDGLSGKQIADALGGYTRNAVIGKLHRLGLAGQGARKMGQHEPTSQQKPRRTSARWPAPIVNPEPTISVTPPKGSIVAPEPKHLTIYQLRDATEFRAGTCKYPFGEVAPYTFCGHPTEPLHPYCSYHRRLCNPSARSIV